MSVDQKAEKYASLSPYCYTASNPVNLIDPNGMEWVNKKDEKIAAQIEKGINKANAKLEKRNAKIQQRIEKASSKGQTDMVNRLREEKDAISEAIGINNRTKNHLAYMGKKEAGVPKFTFENASGNEGFTEVRGDKIVMSVTSSLGNRAHEVSHGWDRSPVGIHDAEEPREVRAYQAQYAADPTSMPPSTAPGTISSVCQINGVYVGGIMRTKPDGTTEPVYKDTNKNYMSSY